MKQRWIAIPFLMLFIIQSATSSTQVPAQAPALPQSKPPPKASTLAPSLPPPKASTLAPSLPPAAQVSDSPGTANITAILEKATHFNTFIRLLKSTQLETLITKQLNLSEDGLTIFVPTDGAFANLKSGSLNTYSEQQKDELLQFHILPSFFSLSQLETVSNPLHTQAGTGGRFMMNITVVGNRANISTGVVNASVSDLVYADNRLAVYEVDKVLFPLDFVMPAAPAPAPKKSKKQITTPSPESSSASSSSSDSSSDDVGPANTSKSGSASLTSRALHLVLLCVSFLACIV